MLLLIDNYDSFTYNLVQYLQVLNCDVHVVRNDKTTVADAMAKDPAAVVISPGPCTPAEAGISVELVRACSGKVPLLGVCLGHQAVGAAFGAHVVKASRIMHGKVSKVTHDGEGVLKGIKSPFPAIRYHSLALERESVPECLKVCAEAEDGEIMAVRHAEHPTFGIQFHPESILTPAGKRILANFLKLAGLR